MKKDAKPKNRKANIIANVIELVIFLLYALVGAESIADNVGRGDVAGMFEDVFGAMFVLTIAIFALAIVCLTVKSMRTKYTVRMSVWNIIWCIGNLYFLFG